MQEKDKEHPDSEYKFVNHTKCCEVWTHNFRFGRECHGDRAVKPNLLILNAHNYNIGLVITLLHYN